LKSLENYGLATESALEREDFYFIGVAHYKLENFREAIENLSPVTSVDDALAQNAFLYIAQSYLALNDQKNAQMAFESAARADHDKAVQENALFNYAISTYNTAFSPFNESVNAFRAFLDKFPNSDNAPKAYEHLADVYLFSNNFEEAYNSIITLQSQNPNILKAKQHLLFNMGVDAFNAPDLPKAIELFTKASAIPQGDLMAQAYFWRGEAYAQMDKQVLARADFNRVFTAKNNAGFLPLIHYNIGYTFFAEKNYNAAQKSFLQYIENENKITPDKFIDALNRLGDCYFQSRDFANAMKFYGKSAEKQAPNSDYALFQMAFIEGLQKNHTNKIALLDKLAKSFPKSDYLDDALFEKSHAYVELNEFKQAIATLDQLTTTHPNSILTPRAIVQKALLYYNLEEPEKAITLYKQVIEYYPNSEEAQVAFESLERLYLEMNQVEDFIAYSQALKGQFSLDKAKEESLLFAAAEQHFAAEHFVEARDLYAKIAEQKGNPFAETAAEKAADIYFEERNFSEAKRYFEILREVSQSRATAQKANLGILRSEVRMLNDEAALGIANQLLAEDITDTDILRELRYYKAKALLELDRPQEAMPLLQELSKEPRTTQGAEAYFLLADCTFTEEKNAEEAEKIVMEFIEHGSPHQYWIARSFILLADMAIEANDDFQAKQYLISLQNNYKGNEGDIREEIEMRLKEIEEREK
jgi:tetratricopeptide (TPR) repeat protein